MRETEHIEVQEHPQTVELRDGKYEMVYFFEIVKDSPPGHDSVVEFGHMEHKGEAYAPLKNTPFVDLPYRIEEALETNGYRRGR